MLAGDGDGVGGGGGDVVFMTSDEVEGVEDAGEFEFEEAVFEIGVWFDDSDAFFDESLRLSINRLT